MRIAQKPTKLFATAEEDETGEVYVVTEEFIDKQLMELLKWAERYESGYFDDLENSLYAPALNGLTPEQKEHIKG